MAYFFVDSVNGSDGNNGTTFDLAWATVGYAVQQSITAGDTIWVRRNVAETLGSSVTVLTAGTEAAPCALIGCPRDAQAATGDFTKGDETVSNISVTVSEELCAGRNIICPDGNTYYVDDINSTSSIELDRPYVGTTSTTASFSFPKDPSYDLFQTMSDGTITRANWNGDANHLAAMDFSSGAYILGIKQYWKFESIKWTTRTADSIGLANIPYGTLFSNIYFPTAVNATQFSFSGSGSSKLANCYFRGGDVDYIVSAATQRVHINRCTLATTDTAGALFYTTNNGNADYMIDNVNYYGPNIVRDLGFARVTAKDFKYTATAIEVDGGSHQGGHFQTIKIENNQKVYGEHRTYMLNVGQWTANDGTSGVTLRTGGASQVVDVLLNGVSGNEGFNRAALNNEVSAEGFAPLVFGADYSGRLYVNDISTAKNYRFYVQSVNDALNGSGDEWDLWLETEYIDGYDATSKSITTKLVKDNRAIAARLSDSDWDNYLQSGSIQPAAVGWVTFKIFCTKYDATDHRYIDTKVDII